MAYLARIEPQAAQPIAFLAKVGSAAVTPDPQFSPLEWSVIRLARVDGMATLREPGPVRRFIDWLTGTTARYDLANPRLEALRRIAVLSWHYGYSVSGEDVAEFLGAGFSPEQYELLVNSVRAVIASTSGRVH